MLYWKSWVVVIFLQRCPFPRMIRDTKLKTEWWLSLCCCCHVRSPQTLSFKSYLSSFRNFHFSISHYTQLFVCILNHFLADFNFQELLKGTIIVESHSSISHYGIRVTIKGSVNLQVPLFFNLMDASCCEFGFEFWILFYSFLGLNWRFVEDQLGLLSHSMVLLSLFQFCKPTNHFSK